MTYLHLIVLFSILTDTAVTSTSTVTNTPTPTPRTSSGDVTLGECTLLMDVQYVHTYIFHTVAGVSWE